MNERQNLTDGKEMKYRKLNDRKKDVWLVSSRNDEKKMFSFENSWTMKRKNASLENFRTIKKQMNGFGKSQPKETEAFFEN